MKEYYKNVVKGHEEELDEKELLSEFDEWKHYEYCVKNNKEEKEEYMFPLTEKNMGRTLQIFSKKRIALFDEITLHKINSITELANITKRDRSAVLTDLEILKEIGMIELKTEGRRVIPIPKYNSVEISFT